MKLSRALLLTFAAIANIAISDQAFAQIKITGNLITAKKPINEEVMLMSIDLLNIAINSDEFKRPFKKLKFACSNKQSMCAQDGFISGKDVYDEILKTEEINLDLKVRKLWNPWKLKVSGTKGVTKTSSTTIKSYNWWMPSSKKVDELLIKYASHIGHEMLHTSYFKYLHSPEKGSNDFVEEKDVAYAFDSLLEQAMRQINNAK